MNRTASTCGPLRALHTASLAFTACLASLVATACASGQDDDPRLPPPRFVDVWVGGPLDSIYNAEYQRLSTECSGRGDACWVEELDTTAVRLTRVWETAEGAEPVGWLVARLRTDGRWPRAALLFQGLGGDEVTLRDDLGDWGYGTTLALRDARENRLRPWLLEPAGDFWIGGSEPSPGFGIVDGPYGLAGRLWRLGPVEAERLGYHPPDGGGIGPEGDVAARADTTASVEVPSGVYMILEIGDGRVRFRPEIPSDMECGGPADAPASDAVPVYEAPLTRLLDADGRPRVEVAYGKGC